MMNDDKGCPFCGAEAIPGDCKPRFKCWTYFPADGTGPLRSNTCCERQLAAQAVLLKQCMEIILASTFDYDTAIKAQVLMTELRKAVG